jgi:hypothetical protein
MPPTDFTPPPPTSHHHHDHHRHQMPSDVYPSPPP